MDSFANPFERLEALLRKLPGIGEKSARRIAVHLMRAPGEYAADLASCILGVRGRVKLCRRCGNLGEGEMCRICGDEKRERRSICVVASVQDLQPCRVREFKVQKHEVRILLPRKPESFLPCLSCRDGIALLGKRLAQEMPGRLLVVHYQNSLSHAS